MANRDNHYEAAFEAYLRARQIPYVAVDEARRTLADGGSIKSLDFIVSPPGCLNWLVDVKGRHFPTGDEQKQYWKNWSQRDDLCGLARWEQIFGPGFQSLLVFAYQLLSDRSPLPTEQVFAFRGAEYAFVAVRLADYAPHARRISTSWDTVAMPTALFRELAVPMETLLTPAMAGQIPSPLVSVSTVGGAAPSDASEFDALECEELAEEFGNGGL